MNKSVFLETQTIPKNFSIPIPHCLYVQIYYKKLIDEAKKEMEELAVVKGKQSSKMHKLNYIYSIHNRKSEETRIDFSQIPGPGRMEGLFCSQK